MTLNKVGRSKLAKARKVTDCQRFLVVSYDSDQEQFFYDLVVLSVEDQYEAERQVKAARPYVDSASAVCLTEARELLVSLREMTAEESTKELANVFQG